MPIYRIASPEQPLDWQEQGPAVIRVMEWYRQGLERIRAVGKDARPRTPSEDGENS
jgi:hypothetical protein